jgi:hypothetical protein
VYAANPYPAPFYAPVPQAAPAAPRPAPPAAARAPQPVSVAWPAPPPAPTQVAAGRAPAPVVRGQMPEEPHPAAAPPKLALPPPEALGVPVPHPAAPVDWTALRVRLDRLGATQFALERLPEGDYRFRCRLPSADPAHPRTVEVRAATEAEAVRQALAQAERP